MSRQVRWAAAVVVALGLGGLGGLVLRHDGGGPSGGGSATGSGSGGVAQPASTPAFVTAPERVRAAMAVRPAPPPTAVRRDGEAALDFRTRPGSSCQVEVQPANRPRDRERLPIRVADDTGLVSWRWSVAPDAPRGAARATVVCSGGASAEVTFQIV